MKRAKSSPAQMGDPLVVEIQRIARELVAKRVPAEVADDIAQDIALECLVKIRAGRWTVRHTDLLSYSGGVVKRRVVDWHRRRKHAGERDAVYAHELKHGEHVWMSPELSMEERELVEAREETLRGLPSACRRAYLLVREEGESYTSAGRRLGGSRSTVNAHVVMAQHRFRRVLSERGLAKYEGLRRETLRADVGPSLRR